MAEVRIKIDSLGLGGLVGHASIQMSERYAHLAPDHLHDAVVRIKFSARNKFS